MAPPPLPAAYGDLSSDPDVLRFDEKRGRKAKKRAKSAKDRSAPYPAETSCSRPDDDLRAIINKKRHRVRPEPEPEEKPLAWARSVCVVPAQWAPWEHQARPDTDIDTEEDVATVADQVEAVGVQVEVFEGGEVTQQVSSSLSPRPGPRSRASSTSSIEEVEVVKKEPLVIDLFDSDMELAETPDSVPVVDSDSELEESPKSVPVPKQETSDKLPKSATAVGNNNYWRPWSDNSLYQRQINQADSTPCRDGLLPTPPSYMANPLVDLTARRDGLLPTPPFYMTNPLADLTARQDGLLPTPPSYMANPLLNLNRHSDFLLTPSPSPPVVRHYLRNPFAHAWEPTAAHQLFEKGAR